MELGKIEGSEQYIEYPNKWHYKFGVRIPDHYSEDNPITYFTLDSVAPYFNGRTVSFYFNDLMQGFHKIDIDFKKSYFVILKSAVDTSTLENSQFYLCST